MVETTSSELLKIMIVIKLLTDLGLNDKLFKGRPSAAEHNLMREATNLSCNVK